MRIELVKENTHQNKKIIQWAYKYLTSNGYTLKNCLPKNVQITPWSYVVRFETSEGYAYLKHTPPMLALEAAIIQTFRDQFHASVPNIIAHNAELHCFLMKDAGKSLREILKQKFDETLLCKAIDQFISLQLAVADRIDVLLDIGVPDWRLNKLPELYTQLLSQRDLLLENGLSIIDISKLEALVPRVSNLCKKLSDYSIKQTFVQPDFNDNNTLIDCVSQDITTIDLGEIAISHPFFSLLNCLEQIKKHHSLTEEEDEYRRIQDSCIKNYINFESNNRLLDAFATARMLWPIYSALCDFRLMNACDKASLSASSFQSQARPSSSLKKFISVCTN